MRREFDLAKVCNRYGICTWYVNESAFVVPYETEVAVESYHVTEIKPGERVISRDDLRNAWRVRCGSSRWDVIEAIEDELFGPEEKS